MLLPAPRGVIAPLALLLGSLLLLQPLALANHEGNPLTEREAEQLAIANNRELQSQANTIEEAKGRERSAGRLSNPEIEVEHLFDTSFADDGEYEFSVGLEQPIPISGRLQAESRVAEREIAIAELRQRLLKRDLTAHVRRIFRELLVLHEKQHRNLDLQETFSEFIQLSEKRFQVAEVSETDLNLEKLELEKLRLEASRLALEDRALHVELNQLLGQPPEFEFTAEGALPARLTDADLAAAQQTAMSRRGEIALAEAENQQALESLGLARAERWEDWKVGLHYFREKSVESAVTHGSSDEKLGVRLTVPLPLWDTKSGAIQEREAAKRRLELNRDVVAERVRSEVAASASRIRELQEILQRYETGTLPLARENLRILKKGYGEGLVGTSNVIQAQQQLVQLEQDYLDELGEYVRERTEFERVTGTIEEAA